MSSQSIIYSIYVICGHLYSRSTGVALFSSSLGNSTTSSARERFSLFFYFLVYFSLSWWWAEARLAYCQINESYYSVLLQRVFSHNPCPSDIWRTRSLGVLRAPTSSLWPFGPALGPSGLTHYPTANTLSNHRRVGHTAWAPEGRDGRS